VAKVPQPGETFLLELDEPCLDCGRAPIDGQFVYYARAPDPEEFRARLMAHGVVDARVVEGIVCTLVDWHCRDETCRERKVYDPAPVARLAERAKNKQ